MDTVPDRSLVCEPESTRRRYDDGDIVLTRLRSGRRRLQVQQDGRPQRFPRGECETSYPNELIDMIASVHGVAWTAEAIARDESPDYLESELASNLFSFCHRERFVDSRMLDFGCGSGASTVVIGRLLPETRVLGIELDARLVRVAEARARHHGLGNVSFLASPDSSSLPPDIGHFDFCMMSAVLEHMLPAERRTLLPRIWNALRPGGVLFLNQTPHRWFPVESHSSGLPLLNYLPDAWAFAAARRFSRQSNMAGWTPEALLRGGLRGATEAEIVGYLRSAADGTPVRLNPIATAYRDRIDLWYSRLSSRYRPIKAAAARILRLAYRLTGEAIVPNVTLAIQKQSTAERPPLSRAS